MLVECIFLIGNRLFIFAFIPLRCLWVNVVCIHYLLVQFNTLVDRNMILICMQGFWVDLLLVNLDLLDLLFVLELYGLFLRHWNLYIST